MHKLAGMYLFKCGHSHASLPGHQRLSGQRQHVPINLSRSQFLVSLQNLYKLSVFELYRQVCSALASHLHLKTNTWNDVVEAHCYVVQYRWIDCEQWRSRINQSTTDCRTFRPRRPSSAAYKTSVCMQLTKAQRLVTKLIHSSGHFEASRKWPLTLYC